MFSKFRVLFVLALLLTGFSSLAQAPFQKNPQIPEFSILASDSVTWITRATLKPGKPAMIILFSPDCDHCIKQMEEMSKSMGKFSDVEIMMTTYQPIHKMKEFEKKFNLSAYKNFHVGRDVRYFFGPYFQLKSTPFIALYNDQHKLLTFWDGGAPVDKILSVIKTK